MFKKIKEHDIQTPLQGLYEDLNLNKRSSIYYFIGFVIRRLAFVLSLWIKVGTL